MNSNPKKPPSFFKIMSNGFTETMRIPPAFMENFVGGVPLIFKLICADSRNSWFVATEGKEEGCFFGSGWSKFVAQQDLELKDFLVFKLVGKSTFEVEIYGRTACKKNTTLAAKRLDGGVHSPAERAGEVKPIKEHTAKRMRPKGADRMARAAVKRAIKLPKKMEMDAEYKESSFQLVLKHYNRFNIIIPRKFARETGLRYKTKTVIRDPEGITWDIHVSVWKSGQTCLSTGWSDFCAANGLDAGTTILLQFSGGTGNEINVQILNRGDENSSSAGESISTPIKRARKFPKKMEMDAEPKESSFQLVLKNYNRFYIIIPRKFARETGLGCKTKTVIRDPEGITWDIHVSVWKSGQTCLSTGWSDFCAANGLDVGTTILLQLSGGTGNEINVQILNRGDGNSRSAGESISTPIKRARKFPKKIEMDAEPKDSSSVQLVLKDYQRYNLFLPKRFAQETGLHRKTMTVIKDPKGKAWDIRISTLFDKKTQPRWTYLSTGWSDFWEANGLDAGTTILLQFCSDSDNEIYIQILNRGDGNSGHLSTPINLES